MNKTVADLSRLSPEEVYGPDMTEMLAMPFETEPVLEDGKCSGTVTGHHVNLPHEYKNGKCVNCGEKQSVDLTKIRHNAARSDMKLARKEKVICIAGTKIGNIELFYDANKKLYSASNFNTGAKFFTNYNATATRIFLAVNYIVEVQ
jgi:hypothetical protein